MRRFERNLICSLTEKIMIKREEMINQAEKSGFTSNETIKASQELDKLLNNYQRLKNDIKNKKYIQPYIKVETLSFKRTSGRLKYSRLG